MLLSSDEVLDGLKFARSREKIPIGRNAEPLQDIFPKDLTFSSFFYRVWQRPLGNKADDIVHLTAIYETR